MPDKKRERMSHMIVATVSLSVLMVALLSQQPSGPPAPHRISVLGLSADEQREILAAVAQSAFDAPDSLEEELSAVRVNLGRSPGIVLQGTKLLCGGTAASCS
jgi:hypothetical protein